MKIPKKSDLIKITDYIWEIPQNFREDMKVPVRVFATENMLDEILEDKSLWQLVNVASLPGIYKYALAMPDAHEGYGFCLTNDAKILTEHGYFVEIKDLDKFLPEIEILSFDKDKKILDKTKVIKFFKLKPYGKILRITTNAGFIIEVTEDHPIFTPEGMKEAKSLMIGDKVTVYGFEGVPYEKPSSNIIVDEEKIKKTFYKIKTPKERSSLEIIIKKLKEKALLPLSYDNPKFSYLIKICAFIFGDGSMNFIGKRKDGILQFSGKKEDLLEIKKDLEKIGYASSKIFKRTHICKDGRTSFRYDFYVNASSLVVLLAALGAPLGRKVNQKYNVPKWLFKAPLWQKRLFLAVLFGCELRKPHRRKERKFGFNAPVFTMNKRIDLIENGKKFLRDIAKLCQEFGVKTTKIQCRRLIVSKDGNKTKALELVFSSSLENLLNLWSKIGYEYNQERKALASLYTIYLKHKKRNLEKRKEILNLIPSFFDQNLSYAKIAESLKSSGFTKRLILDFCYRIKNGYSYKKPKIPQNFITLKEFIKQNSLGKSGFCFDEIEKIEEIEYNDLVYDLTTLSKAHNFIANNFLVSNCVGAVAAFDYNEGIISPGGIGFDINCGVRLAVTDLDYEEVKDKIPKLTEEIFKYVPSGVGRGGFWKLNKDEMRRVLEDGAQYLVELGYGEKEDLEATESFGKLEGADADTVSQTAKDRGRDQLGTMGAGNHFVEIQRISEIFDDADYADFTQTMQTSAKSASYSAKSAISKKLGLEKGKIAVLIHCGSRGLGHQVASDYVRKAISYLDKQNIKLVDRELAYFPFGHPEGQNYFSAMKAAANFAFANRQLILHQVRKAFKKVFGKEIKLRQIYDVAHNIAKIEEYSDWFGLNTDSSDKEYSDWFGLNMNGSNVKINLIYKDLTYRIIGAALEVKKVLGLGQKEIVYQNALEQEFKRKNLNYEREKKIEIKYKGNIVGYYKPDFIIENKILVEIKSVDKIDKEVMKQIWYYLKNTSFILALILNFSKNGLEIKRVLNLKNNWQPNIENLSEKQLSERSVLGPKKSVKLIVHRKGATRAFWKGHPELPPRYQEIGQPTLIPGSMGTASYILIGQELAKEISFGSAPHGAGRVMSRAEAKRKIKGSELKKELESRGIAVAAGSMSGLAEEAPEAYKNVNEVVEVVHQIGIAKKLAKLVPVGVIKG